MANQRDIKRRIGSVANTQKITRAMKLVSAAKFARASHAVTAARPFNKALNAMVERLVAARKSDIESALLRSGEEKNALLVVLSTDRGLCGGLNGNLFKFARGWLNERQKQSPAKFVLAGWGRRAVSWGKKQPEDLVVQKEKVLEKPNPQKAKDFAQELVEAFTSGQYDSIYLAFSEFKSAMVQEPTVVKVLPVSMDVKKTETPPTQQADLIVEPDLEQMIDKLLTEKMTSLVYQALLEQAASEHGSRMSAMDSATNNASEVRRKLTLVYNRARQAAITSELIEIISGAEAL